MRSLLAALLLAGPAAALEFRLPTENHHLFTGRPEKFYMYVDRIFEGETSKPWEGGGFGFVRTPIRLKGEVVMTKFHEGIDIAPIKRDKAGNPLDLVSSIADGVVVHASDVPGRSNYGNYLVVEHRIGDDAFYSLYAHLAQIDARPGDPVKAGSLLGRMGYTGAGIDRTRSHLHLELCLLMSRRYEGWHKTFSGGVNHHGVFNGMNLAGIDIARFFLEHRANPDLRIQDFIRATPAYFKVTVPRKDRFDFAERHRWMVLGGTDAPPPSWEISFTATGLPVAIAPGRLPVVEPIVSAVRDSKHSHRHMTRGLIDGNGPSATLTRGGKSLVALITDDFPLD